MSDKEKDITAASEKWLSACNHTSKLKELYKKISRIKPDPYRSLAEDTHRAVFERTDCLQCANCCRSIPPIVTAVDARRIAKHLRIREKDFFREYVVRDEDGDTVMNSSPCPFLLQDNACAIYEVRPKACRQYPHTGEGTFFENIKLHKQNARICPAVYFILENIEDKIQR